MIPSSPQPETAKPETQQQPEKTDTSVQKSPEPSENGQLKEPAEMTEQPSKEEIPKDESSTDTLIEDLQSLAESLVEDEDDIDTRSEISADEESLPSTFSLGELAWARIGTAPYWPCCITYDPDDKEKYTHVKMMQKSKSLKREYHVQFFGRVQRAWIVSSSMLKFEGIDAFQELANTVSRKQAKAAFQAKGSYKESWNEAVIEIADLDDKTNEERLEICAKMLKDCQKTVANKKRRRPSCDSSETNQQAKRPRFDEAERLIEAIPLKVIDENRRKLKTGFKLFQLANRNELLKDNAEDQLEKILSKMWGNASAAEKSYYKEKANGYLKADTPDNESDAASVASETDNKSGNSKQTPTTSASKKKPPVNRKPLSPAKKMIGLFKKENCCIICEEVSMDPNDIIKCRGVCGGQSFHFECLGITDPNVVKTMLENPKWKCPECESGKHKCNLCHEATGIVIKCSRSGCGRFFHEKCLLHQGLWPQHRLAGDNTLTCPVHMCHTCASDNPKDPFMKYNTKLVRCIRCPTAYHSGDYCVAAGKVIM